MAYRFHLTPVVILAVLLFGVVPAFAQFGDIAQGDRYILTFQNIAATPARWTVLIACPPGIANVEEVLGKALQLDFDSLQIEPLEYGDSVQAIVSLAGCDPNDFRIAVYNESGDEIFTASVDEGTVELVPELAEEFQQFGLVGGDYSDLNLDDYFTIEDQGAVGGFIDDVLSVFTPAPKPSYPPVPPPRGGTTNDYAYVNGVPAPIGTQYVLPVGGEEGTPVAVGFGGQLIAGYGGQAVAVGADGAPLLDAAGRPVVVLRGSAGSSDAAAISGAITSVTGNPNLSVGAGSTYAAGRSGGFGFTSTAGVGSAGGAAVGQSMINSSGRLVSGGYTSTSGFVQYNTGSGNIDVSAAATAARQAASRQVIQGTLSGAGYGQYGGGYGPTFGGGFGVPSAVSGLGGRGR